MDQPTPILDSGHGELPADVIAATPTAPLIGLDKAMAAVRWVNAARRLHAPVTEYQSAERNIMRRPGTCDHCGDSIDGPDENHFLDKTWNDLLCRKNPRLYCDHCLARDGFAEWPCATARALGIDA